MSAPYFDVDTPVPSWGRTITDSQNKTTVQLDGRGGGLIAGITPQTLITHGETVSILTSAYVKNTLQSTANGYEGIGHSLQGFIRGPTGSPVKVYDNNILTNGDLGQWINGTWTDYRRVTFIEQMPDNTHPEWMESVWFTKGTTGQTNLRNMEFRDHYSRRYDNSFGAATWTGFSDQVISSWYERPIRVRLRYLNTIVLRVAQGQVLNFNVNADYQLLRMYDVVATRVSFITGIALKMTRRSDGGADWWITRTLANPDTNNEISDEIVDQSNQFTAKDAYTQIEIIAWMIPIQRSLDEISGVLYEHNGINVEIIINDSVVSGSE